MTTGQSASANLFPEIIAQTQFECLVSPTERPVCAFGKVCGSDIPLRLLTESRNSICVSDCGSQGRSLRVCTIRRFCEIIGTAGPCPDADFGTVFRTEPFLFSPVTTMKKNRKEKEGRMEKHQKETSKQQVNRIYGAPEIC